MESIAELPVQAVLDSSDSDQEMCSGGSRINRKIAMLPKSISSIWWGRDHYLDNEAKQLVLRIVKNSKMPENADAEFYELRIDLTSGRLLQGE
jgi:hypothetical protein